jgi:hypothetical protein
VREFLRRLGVVPFETAIGWVILVSGLVHLLHVQEPSDPLTLLLPEWLTIALSLAYALTGLCIILGIGFGRRDIEGAGLTLLIAASSIRLAAVFNAAGFVVEVYTAIVYYTVLLLAASARLGSLIRREVVIRVRDHGSNVENLTDIDEGDLRMRDKGDDDE